MSTLDRGAEFLSDWLATAADVVQGSTVSLAVTGLSRAGKTVFITSLAHNLLSATHQPFRMPLLRVAGEGRLIAARLAQSRGGAAAALLPYQRNVEQMAGTPADWPARTRDISEVEIEIRFMPTGAYGFLLNRSATAPRRSGSRSSTIPGEWLLDLPLLAQSYADGRAPPCGSVAPACAPRSGATSSAFSPTTAPTRRRARRPRAARTSSIAPSCSPRATSTA